MEEQVVANHSDASETSVESFETPNTTSSDTPVTTQESVMEPKGINVKYNKEDRFVPEEEVPTWVQKGLNYDKVQERANQAELYQKNLDRIAKFYGFDTHDAYMTALEQAEHDRMVREEAEKFGVPEDFIRQELSPLKNEIDTLRKERERFQQQEAARQVENEVNSLKTKYPDFSNYEKQVFNMVINGEAGNLEAAYRLASYDDKLAAVAKQKEQEVLANVTRRSEKQVLSSNDGASDTQFSIANASFDDIRKISERVQRGERITL